MKIDDITLLFKYNYWANRQILAQAANLSTEELYAPKSFSFESLGGTLVHILDAEYAWRILLKDREFITSLKPTDFPDLAAIVTHWETEEAAMWAYLNSLTDDNMDDIINYSGEGFSRSRVLWHCLLHVVNHGTQHRSECAVMLTNLNQSPGDIDLMIFLN